jgi:LEM3 (ligand-effect modulator 3) family / CDC50 family
MISWQQEHTKLTLALVRPIYDPNIDFPVTEYGGTKTMVLSTRTVIGGQNSFLGIAYVVVAGLCILLGAIFTARHLIKPRYPMSDGVNLENSATISI